MKFGQFWRFYDEYLKTKFKDEGLAMGLSDKLHRMLEDRPMQRGGRDLIGHIALAHGKPHHTYAGGISVGDVLVLDASTNDFVLFNNMTPRQIPCSVIFTDASHYRIWLPLFELQHVVTAIAKWPKGLEFYDDWIEKRERQIA